MQKFPTEEEYIINESAELSIGEASGWINRISSAFPAFESRNFRLYFYGQLVSLIGTWLQVVAQGWLVLELTNSAFLLGIVAAAGSAPSLIFSLFAGVIVDRFSKRHILIFTQIAAMALAFILGILTITHLINVTEIAILAFLLGTVTALDIPARQAYAVDLVKKNALASAIAINAGTFNAARVIGPSIAGLLIALVGTGGAFIANGISYIAVIIALLFINTPVLPKRTHLHPLNAIKEGLLYSFSHPAIRTLLIFTGVSSLFGWSYGTIMPLIAKDIFHTDASGLGYLLAANGLGALGATFFVSAFSKKFSRLFFIIGGNALFALALFIFTYTNTFLFAIPFLFLAGLGLITQFAVINTELNHTVDDHLRGRVLSIYTLMFLGLSPAGSFQIGYLAEHFGPGFAIRVGAVILFLFGIIIWSRKRNL